MRGRETREMGLSFRRRGAFAQALIWEPPCWSKFEVKSKICSVEMEIEEFAGQRSEAAVDKRAKCLWGTVIRAMHVGIPEKKDEDSQTKADPPSPPIPCDYLPALSVNLSEVVKTAGNCEQPDPFSRASAKKNAERIQDAGVTRKEKRTLRTSAPTNDVERVYWFRAAVVVALCVSASILGIAETLSVGVRETAIAGCRGSSARGGGKREGGINAEVQHEGKENTHQISSQSPFPSSSCQHLPECGAEDNPNRRSDEVVARGGHGVDWKSEAVGRTDWGAEVGAEAKWHRAGRAS
ncbi:hypothetical protein B0H16DRAFT_1456086 [Mycena metata]|uniref:Uncharacterized protein n=1 Tax=Mycena metata TaxID=1033252 RepID=A0AAD7JDW5_9AGAR|nr:hypothetical protein B0H16DRAFT_1456086 [Mycena metata]